MILNTSIRSIKKAATKIATNKKRSVNPKAKHRAHTRIVTNQANRTRIVTFLELTAVIYQVGNCRAKNWFTAIPKTDQKVANMQIADAAMFIN